MENAQKSARWGFLFLVGVILIIAGFSNRVGAVAAAMLAPGALAPTPSSSADTTDGGS